MQFIIDRFEGEYAVCEIIGKKEMINIPIVDLPERAQEGTVIDIVEGKYVVNENETFSRSNRIKDLMNSLWEE